jgi:hypothetical protein
VGAATVPNEIDSLAFRVQDIGDAFPYVYNVVEELENILRVDGMTKFVIFGRRPWCEAVIRNEDGALNCVGQCRG